ncbi:MAG: beta-propeller domain-containing protein [Porticoccaceae bacterium]
MSSSLKSISSCLVHGISILAVLIFITPAYAGDSTTYVRLTDSPFSPPHYIFSTSPNGESIDVALEKGFSHTFIRTDGGHAFNIGDGWKAENSQIQATGNGSGGVVGTAASIVGEEQLTISIPEDFSGDSLSYFCYAHSSMIGSLSVVENSTSDTDDNTGQPNQILNWDFDANGETDALTDGLLLLRYAFGLRDGALTNNAVAIDSPLTNQQIMNSMSTVSNIADIDGSGEIDALTDGLLLLRYLFGLQGDSLISGSLAINAARITSQEIEQYIASHKPAQSLVQLSGLLVPMSDSLEFSTKLIQSYDAVFGVRADVMIDAMPEMAMDAATSDSGGDSFTTTYTLEKTIDEHDFVKYDGENNHLFIAPSYSMYDDCCFIFEEPIALVDDAIVVGEDDANGAVEEPSDPTIPEQRAIKIMATDPDHATVEQVGNIIIDDNRTIEGLYINDNQLASINSSGWWGMYGPAFMEVSNWRGQTTGVTVYDISDVTDPKLDWKFEIDGGFVTSRKKGDIVYLVARHTPQITNYIDFPTVEQEEQNQQIIDDVSPSELLPKGYINDQQFDLLSTADCLAINDSHDMAPDQYGYPTMTMLVAINVAEKTVVNSSCYLESTSGVYVSQNGIYLIQSEGWGSNARTILHRFNLSANLGYTGSGEVQGHLFGSGEIDFRINEHKGYLRVVSSNWTGDSEDSRDHQLTVLKQSPETYSMTQVATLPSEEHPNEIGKPNEDLYGVRFFGDTLYLVTFERTDPLYVLDLSDQENPIVAGELEVTGFSDFLHPVNDDLLLGLGQDENGLVKLELFNVSSMQEPVSQTALSIGSDAGWSYSPARYNRHAFTYQRVSETTDRFSVPVTLSSPSMGYYQENRLYTFSIFNKDQADAASIFSNGYISGGSGNWWNNDRQRAVFHGESIFYINGENVISSFWEYPED